MLRRRDVHNGLSDYAGQPAETSQETRRRHSRSRPVFRFINSSITHRLPWSEPCPAAYQRRGSGYAGGLAAIWRKLLPGMAANGDVSRR
jgi:hypothetical protein